MLLNSSLTLIYKRLLKGSYMSAWTEREGIIYFKVVSDGTTGEEWVTRLKKRNYSLGRDAEGILRSNVFLPTNNHEYRVAVIKGIKFTNPTNRRTLDINRMAKNYNFADLNLEVACLIREIFSDEDIESMGLTWILLMNGVVGRDLRDYYSRTRHLLVSSYGSRSLLDACFVDANDTWSDRNGFAYLCA